MRPTRFEIFVLIVVLALAAYIFVPLRREGRDIAMRDACLANLRTLGTGMSAYLEANDSRWPYMDKLRSFSRHEPQWSTVRMVLEPYVKSVAPFECPADSRTIEDPALREKYGATTTWFTSEGMSYEWLWPEPYGGHRVGEEKLSRLSGKGRGRADQDLLSDFEAFHSGAGRVNKLYADFAARPGRSESEQASE